MTDARETAPETPSGEPLDTAPDEADGVREPYDADGVIEPEHDTAEDEDPLGDDR